MMKKIILTILISLSISLFCLPSAFAKQTLTIPDISTLPGPSEAEQEEGSRNVIVERIIPRGIVAIVGFVGIAALAFLVISGVRFAMAYGNEENIEKAKNQVIYAIVGFLIALLSYTIVSVIANLDLGQNAEENAETGFIELKQTIV
jgi:hypothetical protein